jgi:opacity protein-like surface antigen
MKRILSMAILALAISSSAALAQTTPGVSTIPSAPNSGAGIAGQPGNKSGAAAKPGDTVGSGAGANQQNPADLDTSNIKGLPGNKSGPPAKQLERK